MLSIDNDAGVTFQFIWCQYEARRCFIITCQNFRVGMRVFHYASDEGADTNLIINFGICNMQCAI